MTGTRSNRNNHHLQQPKICNRLLHTLHLVQTCYVVVVLFFLDISRFRTGRNPCAWKLRRTWKSALHAIILFLLAYLYNFQITQMKSTGSFSCQSLFVCLNFYILLYYIIIIFVIDLASDGYAASLILKNKNSRHLRHKQGYSTPLFYVCFQQLYYRWFFFLYWYLPEIDTIKLDQIKL